ncbi:LacI family DNA-binding transcriptional regulator [Paenibacillus barengoltzii]|uniref:LacI family DNA-binding transcriptional regulator n=1 Tax=Paenibacillus barengoltzii TaxID=343517 RepID=UPI002DB99111|nr:LacI family DNA-binding transcriptional regulator [Paenibacillus barengoltzii]MEC2346659.1 LacI family DNA-binding transcriptional regulator [Paenibacillus barengoltzii]
MTPGHTAPERHYCYSEALFVNHNSKRKSYFIVGGAMTVSIKEIARICGVSIGTVDRALNNRPGISPKTKEKILKVAKEKNYRPDYRAQSLVKGKTKTIGVVLFDLKNRSFALLMNAIESELRRTGYSLHLTLTDKDKKKEIESIKYLIDRKVDGIILFSVNQGKEFNTFLNSINIPIVTIFNHVSDQWHHIGVQERKAMQDAVKHTISKGYKRFVFICPPLSLLGKVNIYTQHERLKGFQDGLKEFNMLDQCIIIKEKDYLKKVAEGNFVGKEKTAILCTCDAHALEVMRFFKDQKVNIPGEIGIMGFDNIDVLRYVEPKLTTVEYPINEIGIRAVESLVCKLEKGTFPSVPLLDYKIIPGESI